MECLNHSERLEQRSPSRAAPSMVDSHPRASHIILRMLRGNGHFDNWNVHPAQVTIAYVDCAEPSGTRARELASRFLFNCTCAKCSRGQEDDEVKRALRCPQGACPGWMQPWGEEDWEPHRRRFVARSFGEHVAQTVAPWGDWLEVGQDAGTLKDEIQGWGGFDG